MGRGMGPLCHVLLGSGMFGVSGRFGHHASLCLPCSSGWSGSEGNQQPMAHNLL